MKYKHTSGVWRYEFESISSISPKGHFNIKAGSASTTIAMLPLPLWGEIGGCKQEANARVITVAPKMFLVLDKFVNLKKYFDTKGLGDQLYDEFLSAYSEAIELLNEIRIDKNKRNKF